jgi:ZIP family zinc transporter
MWASIAFAGVWAARADGAAGAAAEAAAPAGGAPLAFWTPLLMSVLAGAATGFGALFVLLLDRRPKARHLSFFLSLAAGVMITVSLFDMLLPTVRKEGWLLPCVAAAVGALSFHVLMKLLPDPDKLYLPLSGRDQYGHGLGLGLGLGAARRAGALGAPPTSGIYYLGPPSSDGSDDAGLKSGRQWRLGSIMMMSLSAHNFPEGLAVSVSELKGHTLGVAVTCAIMLHNIPEGLAIAVPLYAASGSKRYAIGMAFLSGLTEPLGALLALTVLHRPFSAAPWAIDYVLCFVAGVMIMAAMQELVPEALGYKDPKAFVAGFAAGSLVMLLTILVLP